MALLPITPRQVVVTGIGVVTPLGSTKESFWSSLVNGRSGIGQITKMDSSSFPVHIAGEVKGFDPLNYMDRKDARHMDPFTQYAYAAAVQAIDDSAINFDETDRDIAGVILGSGIGGMKSYEEQHDIFVKRGPRRISPFFITMLISDIAAGHIAIKYDLRGSNYATTSACATSAHAIGCAMKAIRYGEADVVVTGGSEAPLTSLGLGGFCSMKALSVNNDDPEKACRPFDAERNGFIMAEGAAILVLEDLDHALNRGADIYAEIAGCGFSCDAHHITAPPDDGRGAALSMLKSIQDSGLEPADVDYINAHGTSTPLNDKAETKAIKKVFGTRAYEIAVSSTKSMHGHMLGAAGGVETAATLLAINRGRIPPTINYENPDPDCDLNYTPNIAVTKKISVAISNNFGFGGHNASLVIKQYS